MYDTLDLSDAYAVVGYYLRHKAEVEGYLAEYDREAEEVWKKIRARQGDSSGIRARLLARKAALDAQRQTEPSDTQQLATPRE